MSDHESQPDETERTGEDEPTAEEAWEQAGGDVENADMSIFGRIALVLKMLVVGPLTWILKHVPRTDGLADVLIMAGLNYKKKLAKADAITWVIYGDGQVVPRAARWQSKEREYLTDNGEKISADGEGHQPYFMGKTPVTFSLRSAAETFDPVLAFFAKKAELGEWMQTKKPDGGTDVVVDSSIPRGKDGLILSWEKAWELYGQKISREDLEEQYRIGYLDGVDGDGTTLGWKLLLAYGAGILSMLVILWALNNFIGGGGGGSIVPLMAGVF